ncbi:divergent polysaccharide deacetylase family protein [Salmonella enterica subsp. enterica]|nr:divergent polysaccharide deacetylase family protein [Salmonella enterica subsp. enterica]
MSNDEDRAHYPRAVNNVPYAVGGLTNHVGSAADFQPVRYAKVMQALEHYNLLFSHDSMTIGNSRERAPQHPVRSVKVISAKFLDDTQTRRISPSVLIALSNWPVTSSSAIAIGVASRNGSRA